MSDELEKAVVGEAVATAIRQAYRDAARLPKCRASSMVLTKLDEAAMWLVVAARGEAPGGGPMIGHGL